MIKVLLLGSFDRDYERLLKQDKELGSLVLKRIDIFKRNPDDTRLRNHTLRKRMRDKWSFSITDNIRIVYEWTNKTTVRFLAIGKHEEVY